VTGLKASSLIRRLLRLCSVSIELCVQEL